MRPQAGELWRFLVDATPGPRERADKRRVEVLTPPGQERRLFAARPGIRIPGAAPMTYVDDPTPASGSCWYDEDENGPGYYSEQYSPPRPVLGAWGRTPAQAAASESQSKVAASRDAFIADFARVNGRDAFLASKKMAEFALLNGASLAEFARNNRVAPGDTCV